VGGETYLPKMISVSLAVLKVPWARAVLIIAICGFAALGAVGEVGMGVGHDSMSVLAGYE